MIDRESLQVRSSPRPAGTPPARARPGQERTQRLPAGAGCACGGQCPRCAGGRPLPATLARSFGAMLDADLAPVRLHDDPTARSQAACLGARAFVQGRHIHLGAAAPGLETPAGQRLLAHELIHVVQQSRPGEGFAPGARNITTAAHSSEVEARTGAERLLGGQSFRPRQSAPGLVQREEGTPGDGTATAEPAPAAGTGQTLTLDQALLQRLGAFLASWLAEQLGNGTVAAPLSGLGAQPGGTSTPGGGPSGFTLTPPPGLNLSQAYQFGTSTPDYLAPLPPDPTYRPPDFSALYGPHNTRGVPFANRDSPDFLEGLYRPRWQLVAGLPDLRSMAPTFLRDQIPTTWRVDLASALTGLTADSQLKGDFPTAIEAADRALVQMTGNKDAAPTYINPPFPPFKWSF